jgi:hypothetical protein
MAEELCISAESARVVKISAIDAELCISAESARVVKISAIDAELCISAESARVVKISAIDAELCTSVVSDCVIVKISAMAEELAAATPNSTPHYQPPSEALNPIIKESIACVLRGPGPPFSPPSGL